ncbi:hypothetical protein [Microbacterium sp. Mcb102]|uniref:hypothetical protein n=1 Tax=Microbacterium sp. Mcb102 TaxID=2926012 RepID=UPI0021C9BA01|nr:hypothetical protein [Microbacterium sp. Mcb102]
MGIFGRNIKKDYAERAALELMRPSGRAPVGIVSPWAPAGDLQRLVVDDTLKDLLGESAGVITREAALKVPGVARAHGIACTTFASIPKFEMEGDVQAKSQAPWLTTSASGVAPYHRDFGAASDWFFEGWACYGFTADMDDCLHIPFGMWFVDEKGFVQVTSDLVPAKYTANPIAIPIGYGEDGLLVNGATTIRQSQKIEDAYQNRLDNPIALTVLTLEATDYFGYSKEQRAAIRDEWNEGRRKNSTGLVPSTVKVEFPGASMPTDLYETGRNANRLDIANHTSMPASILEGVRQGGSGGGTEMRYQGVGNGGERSDLWEYGLARRMLLAFEARMSLDDVVAPGHSIRGDQSNMHATPNPDSNPTSED